MFGSQTNRAEKTLKTL